MSDDAADLDPKVFADAMLRQWARNEVANLAAVVADGYCCHQCRREERE